MQSVFDKLYDSSATGKIPDKHSSRLLNGCGAPYNALSRWNGYGFAAALFEEKISSKGQELTTIAWCGIISGVNLPSAGRESEDALWQMQKYSG